MKDDIIVGDSLTRGEARVSSETGENPSKSREYSPYACLQRQRLRHACRVARALLKAGK
jgi:hypothetical protein